MHPHPRRIQEVRLSRRRGKLLPSRAWRARCVLLWNNAFNKSLVFLCSNHFFPFFSHSDSARTETNANEQGEDAQAAVVENGAAANAAAGDTSESVTAVEGDSGSNEQETVVNEDANVSVVRYCVSLE